MVCAETKNEEQQADGITDEGSKTQVGLVESEFVHINAENNTFIDYIIVIMGRRWYGITKEKPW